jgi:hypothetical protein
MPAFHDVLETKGVRRFGEICLKTLSYSNEKSSLEIPEPGRKKARGSPLCTRNKMG